MIAKLTAVSLLNFQIVGSYLFLLILFCKCCRREKFVGIVFGGMSCHNLLRLDVLTLVVILTIEPCCVMTTNVLIGIAMDNFVCDSSRHD